MSKWFRPVWSLLDTVSSLLSQTKLKLAIKQWVGDHICFWRNIKKQIHCGAHAGWQGSEGCCTSRAAEGSTEMSRACGFVLATSAPCSIPAGRGMSSQYCAAPVTCTCHLDIQKKKTRVVDCCASLLATWSDSTAFFTNSFGRQISYNLFIREASQQTCSHRTQSKSGDVLLTACKQILCTCTFHWINVLAHWQFYEGTIWYVDRTWQTSISSSAKQLRLDLNLCKSLSKRLQHLVWHLLGCCWLERHMRRSYSRLINSWMGASAVRQRTTVTNSFKSVFVFTAAQWQDSPLSVTLEFAFGIWFLDPKIECGSAVIYHPACSLKCSSRYCAVSQKQL